MSSATSRKPSKKSNAFRVGRVRAYLRGRVWYLCYHEHGRRRQPRVGPDKSAAQRMAAEINAQLLTGIPSALGFEPIAIPELRLRWLDHHEYVRRSSINTVRRYRSATQHLIDFIERVRPLRRVSDFQPIHAEEFVRYLRSLKTAPNGHHRAAKRRLRDGGVKYILETCCTLLNYAQRHRHLSPYAENPFRMIEIGRIPIEDAKPVIVFDADRERRLLEACDDWQFPVFLTLLLTGLRPGELTHLLLPDDLDLEDCWLRVRNKPRLGWQIKTRNQRDIPIMPALADVVARLIGDRRSGPVFQQRRCFKDYLPPLAKLAAPELEHELARRIAMCEGQSDAEPSRDQQQAIARKVWRDMGALRTEWIRIEFMRLTSAIGIPEVTAPKTLRHTFATVLQDGNVDPLIRCELMGHAIGGSALSGNGLGMTAVYTHTRPDTKRRQLEAALQARPAIAIAQRRRRRDRHDDSQTAKFRPISRHIK